MRDSSIPIRFSAYYAVIKGTNIDQPRNLAKISRWSDWLRADLRVATIGSTMLVALLRRILNALNRRPQFDLNIELEHYRSSHVDWARQRALEPPDDRLFKSREAKGHGDFSIIIIKLNNKLNEPIYLVSFELPVPRLIIRITLGKKAVGCHFAKSGKPAGKVGASPSIRMDAGRAVDALLFVFFATSEGSSNHQWETFACGQGHARRHGSKRNGADTYGRV